ncbi:MAG: dolichol-phosphate mannosyltransferase [Nocardioidaceae bacterium]|nr:dolichol-phosphate mannosyltransferase [Nocardioidaceae bacterium]
MNNVLVVVPTFDEAGNIATLIERVLVAEPRADILVVDDGSPDGTGDLVADVASTEPRVHLLRRSGKSGLGSAYRAGFAWGREQGYDVLIEMDADLSHPADRLPALVDGLGQADLVIGSRYVAGGGTANWPWTRQAISRVGNAYVRLALGVHVNDATAGFRAFNTDILDRIGFAELTSDGYCFQVETTYRTARAGGRITEVPITFTERVHGSSKMSNEIVREALWRVTMWGIGDLFRRGSTNRGAASPRRRAGAVGVLFGVAIAAAWALKSLRS